MSQALPFTMRTALPGSPTAVFHDRIAAELADGTIPCACPHPVGADRLYLPSRTLLCHDCSAEADDRPDGAPGPCTACGAAGACGWTVWLDERARVLVIAQVCEDCGTAGNVPVSWN